MLEYAKKLYEVIFLKHKRLFCGIVLSLLLTVPAWGEFVALERDLTNGNIICNFTSTSYTDNNGKALTEQALSQISGSGYTKTGLTADGNTRLILRYQSDSAGVVSFSAPSYFVLENLSNREILTSSTQVQAVRVGSKYQASAVLIAPETFPADLTFPSGNFTVTANFTPDTGSATSENLDLTLRAPTVVLLHGLCMDSAKTFGHGTNIGVWDSLEKASFDVVGVNYDWQKLPRVLISNDNNVFVRNFADIFDALNESGIASTRLDLVAHSTGGIIARQFLRNDLDTGNKSALSYNQGMIRRVVTLAAPNNGTPWGSYFSRGFSRLGATWKAWEGHSAWELACGLLKIYLDQKYPVSDLMGELGNSSGYLTDLGYPNVPFHSIYDVLGTEGTEELENTLSEIKKGVVATDSLSWLPEQFVISLQKHISTISMVANVVPLDGFFNALFDGNEHDLCVADKSATHNFPANATTKFEGLDYSHVVIGKKDAIAERVIALLKGDLQNFMVNTASTSRYDAAFDVALANYEDYLAKLADDADDYSELYDDSLDSLDTGELTKEYFGGEEDDEVINIQSFTFSAAAKDDDNKFNNDVYMRVSDMKGSAQFFKVAESGDISFENQLWLSNENVGVIELSYMMYNPETDKTRVSYPVRLVIPPILDSGVKRVFTPNSKIYLNVGDEVALDLFLQINDRDKIFNVAAPELGLAEWENEDASVAEVLDTGEVRALKSGSTTLTAKITENGKTYDAKVTVVVLSEKSDSSSNSSSHRSSGGGGGGCDSGFSFMTLALVFAVQKLRTKK